MTPQEALDRNWDWFITQKKPLGQEFGCPCYIAADGCRCAIGILLPSDLILTDVQQSHSVSTLCLERESVAKALKGLEDNFLGALQVAHDSCVVDGKRIYDTLRALARRFELQTPAATHDSKSQAC